MSKSNLMKTLNRKQLMFLCLFLNFFLCFGSAFAESLQSRKVTGTVSDSKGETIIGANVSVKGTTTGTYTGADGGFTIEVPNAKATLVVTFLGYSPAEVVVGSQTYLKVVLQDNDKVLSEVVVVGYGTQKKESLTGSLQTIKSDKLVDITTPNAANLLSGKAPGVFVAPGSGQPGSEAAIVIRGKSTVNGSTAPLWVIDGVIVGSDAGALNPADIESVTILKDAASTAIYGSQGANGVILVTTKKAKAQKMTITASAKVGFSNLNNGNLEVMNGAELYDYYKSFSNAEDISFPRWNSDLRNSNFNWWDLATQTGVAQDYNISMTGGDEKLRSYFSAGVYDEEGAVKGYDYTRYNFRLKTDYKPYEWLTIKPSISGSKNNIKDRQYSVTAMYSNLPWDNPYDSKGNIVGNYSDTWVNSNSTNYLYDLQWDFGKSTDYEFMGNFDFDVKIND